MMDHRMPERGAPGFAHRVLDRLTAMKLRVGSLRLHVKHGDISAQEMETHLARIEQEIDMAAMIAQDVQGTGGSASRA